MASHERRAVLERALLNLRGLLPTLEAEMSSSDLAATERAIEALDVVRHRWSQDG